jgi:hypothetical protein
MDLKEIMSVSGQSGLFRFVSQGRNGIIVESFSDKKRVFVSASQKVSSLSDIAIFTEGDEVPLKDVMKSIYDMAPGAPAPDAKSTPEELKQFMGKALPNYDRNRVYMSDIKKLVTWYNALLALDLLKFDEEAEKMEEVAVKPDDKNESDDATAAVKTKTATSKAKKPTTGGKKAK